MEQLQKLLLPEESLIDQGNYFQSLLAAVFERNLLSEAELNKLQYSLAELLAKQTERYTNGESSSVTVERAQSLLQAICYHISVYLKSIPVMEQKINLIKEEKLEVLLRRGIEEVSRLYHEAEEKLKKLQATSIKYDNQAYQDTLYKGLSDFFHDYELEFAPQEECGSIDYPLCREIVGSSGIEYIHTYLRQLEEESLLISYFPKEQIEALLKGFHKDYRELLINIYELVLTNALGTILLDKDLPDLSIDSGDREWLQRKLAGRSKEELKSKLTTAYEVLQNTLGHVEVLPGYGRECAEQLAERLFHNLQLSTLEQIFITSSKSTQDRNSTSRSGAAHENDGSYAEQYQENGSIFYEEGARMEDDKLRELIEALNSMRFTMDKLAEIKREVHSLDDLTELLPVCFDKEEYDEVFGLLSDTELDLLYQRIEEEADNPYRMEEPRLEWQNCMTDYYQRRRQS